ncbi:MAG: hypothetical protein H6832_02880 [Planctomycetes bacterium]|nr:hypothetical protein [Planctomycetota bacterium]MCB9917326.1 hypothetical protein [Planctomycetota bacterium]
MHPVEPNNDDPRAEEVAADRLRSERLDQDRVARRHCANFAGLVRRDPLPRSESAANSRTHPKSVPHAAEHLRRDPGAARAETRLTNRAAEDRTALPELDPAEPKARPTTPDHRATDRESSRETSADECPGDPPTDAEIPEESWSGHTVSRGKPRVVDAGDPRAQLQRIAAFACLIDHAPEAYEFQLRLGREDWRESVQLALTSLGQRRVRVRLTGRESSELSDAVEGLREELAALGLQLVDVCLE